MSRSDAEQREGLSRGFESTWRGSGGGSRVRSASVQTCDHHLPCKLWAAGSGQRSLSLSQTHTSCSTSRRFRALTLAPAPWPMTSFALAIPPDQLTLLTAAPCPSGVLTGTGMFPSTNARDEPHSRLTPTAIPAGMPEADAPPALPVPWRPAAGVAYLGEVEGSDSAVIIQENIDSVQSPRTFGQKT